MPRLLTILAGLLVMWASSATAADGPVQCVQSYLAAIGYPVGAIDGQLGKKTIGYGNTFAAVYPDLKLPELNKETAAAWCENASGPAGTAVLASRPIPAANAPADTIAKGGGLNFRSKLVTENYIYVDELKHGFEASKRPGRVSVDVDPERVHMGESSIRMHLLPGDCDWSTNRDSGEWNDCDHFNERVDTTASPTKDGEWYYGLSLMIGVNMLDLVPYPNPWIASEVNFFQWYQYDSGACFNLLYNATLKALSFDVRCSTGKMNHRYIKLILEDSRPDVWHEFVVHANWSSSEDGFFRVVQNGKMVMSYSGPTIVPQGRPLINDHPQLYVYGGDDERESARMHYRTPMTAWFDGMVRSRKLSDISKLYEFPEAALTDFDAALPIMDFEPSRPKPIVVLTRK